MDADKESFCVIQDLLCTPFGRRTLAEKNEIIKKGRPCPAIPNLTSKHKEKTKEYVRHFNVSFYENCLWLTGSKNLKKLFCWPCLLFSKDGGVWSNKGFDNLNTLTTAVSKHEKSMNHLKAFLQLNAFGRVRIDHQLNQQSKIADSMHNEKVKKNREILKRLIDAVIFLGKQELPFRGHDESSSSENKGNYIELLELIRKYDPVLDNHLNESTIFRGTSPSIQNDLLNSVNLLILEKIKEDISKAEFAAILLDETSDVINKSQLSTVLRYVDINGMIQERFVGFTDVSSDRSASGLLEHAKKTLSDFKCENKLIAQTYDGAAVMAGQIKGLNKLVEDIYPSVLFVHCYSHVLNLTLQQSVSRIKECRVFFQTLSALAAFFSKSSKRTHSLQLFAEKKLPRVAATRWNFSSRLINTTEEQHELLIAFFSFVLENSEEWDSETVLQSQGFISFLNERKTKFLLKLFSLIFSYTDVLYNILQTKSMDIAYCLKKVADTSEKLKDIRENEFPKIWERIHQNEEHSEPVYKRRKTNQTELSEDIKCKQLMSEILDNILVQIQERFKTLEKMKFLSLLESDSFERFSKQFPENELKSLENQYGKYFDILRLKNELMVIYSSPEFRNKPVFELLNFMFGNKLNFGFKEFYKFVVLISTIPATTSSVERSFSALKRIKTFCRSTQGQERLNSLAIISIEKNILNKLKSVPTFYDNVIENFLKKERRAEFLYK